MKRLPLLALLLFAAFSKAEPLSGTYQITYTIKQSDLFMIICIKDQCQKILSNKQESENYVYDFGTFKIEGDQAIELRPYKLSTDKRRIQRAPELLPDPCNLNECGSFNLIKSNQPITATNKCDVGVATCHYIRDRQEN
jgi:hypothetical protein